MITLLRCDDRLIHGQCVVRVVSDFKIRHIVVIDDFVARNTMLKKLFVMAAPQGVGADVLSVEEAVSRIEEFSSSAQNILILVKNPVTALSLYQKADKLKNDLNIGPMSNRPDSIKVTLYASLTKEEASAISEIVSMGIRVYFNQVIDQITIEWDDIKDKF